MNMIPTFLKPAPMDLPLSSTLADDALSAVGRVNAARAQGRAALRKYRDRLRIEIARAEDALAKVEAELSLEDDLTVAGNFAEIEAEIGGAVEEIKAHASPSPKPDKPKKTRAGEAKAG